MSDDDGSSIDTNPFERTVLTEERLAYFEKIRQEHRWHVSQGPRDTATAQPQATQAKNSADVGRP
jgi:hypothetical protein